MKLVIGVFLALVFSPVAWAQGAPCSAISPAVPTCYIGVDILTSVSLGAPTDVAWVSGSGSLIAIAKTIAGSVAGPIPAGSALIGKTGLDQTTQGTTNGVTNGAHSYQTVAASQSAAALTGGSGGATGDYLSHCTIVPASTSPGVVTILDNSTAIYSFPGGASSLSNLAPFSIPIGAVSVSGAWKITTGANVSVVCVGKFT